MDLCVQLIWLVQIFLGTVFVLSGISKFLGGSQFRDTLAAMELVPPPLSEVFAYLLPPLEVVAGLSVILGWWWTTALGTLAGLVTLFALMLSLYRWRGGRQVVCGCFGDFQTKSSTLSLIGRNLLLLALLLMVMYTLPAEGPAIRDWGDWLYGGTVVVGLLQLWMLTARLVVTVHWLRTGISDENA
jgi:uncharacterized membrane protein YphA (DoxX/SURF4 family)